MTIDSSGVGQQKIEGFASKTDIPGCEAYIHPLY